MFNPSSSSVEYSCNTHIEVCDDIAAHLKRDSSNFLTDVGLQGFNGLWVVVVHPLLQVPPIGSSLREKDQESRQAMGCSYAVR